ncbi:MAG TPA: hypothetical protein DIV86_05755 [Alphaproteobacteria bacterium]|nr:hypothetical protein [Alphaproteobacteria bacterium]
MELASSIEDILRREFAPEFLKITNNSYQHKGHKGDDGSGQTHFLVEISSKDIPESFTHKKHKLIVEKLSEVFKLTHSIEIKLV